MAKATNFVLEQALEIYAVTRNFVKELVDRHQREKPGYEYSFYAMYFFQMGLPRSYEGMLEMFEEMISWEPSYYSKFLLYLSVQLLTGDRDNRNLSSSDLCQVATSVKWRHSELVSVCLNIDTGYG
jgi:hypothetical protein